MKVSPLVKIVLEHQRAFKVGTAYGLHNTWVGLDLEVV